jgi:hypothetical protein
MPRQADGWDDEDDAELGQEEAPAGAEGDVDAVVEDDAYDESGSAPEFDWVLERLVREANRFDLQVGITFTVSGSVITGTLVGVRRFLNAYAEVAQRVYRDGAARARARAYYAELGATLERQTNEEALLEEQGRGAAPPARFVHLVNARYLPATRDLPADGGFLWRGRLSQVDGFSLGTVE